MKQCYILDVWHHFALPRAKGGKTPNDHSGGRDLKKCNVPVAWCTLGHAEWTADACYQTWVNF